MRPQSTRKTYVVAMKAFLSKERGAPHVTYKEHDHLEEEGGADLAE